MLSITPSSFISLLARTVLFCACKWLRGKILSALRASAAVGYRFTYKYRKKIPEQQLSLSYAHSVLTNWSSTPWKKAPKTVYWNSPVQKPNCFTWVKTGSNHFSHLRLHKKYVDLFFFFYSCLANLCLADLMSLLAWVPSRSSLMQISISFFFFWKKKEYIKKKKAK